MTIGVMISIRKLENMSVITFNSDESEIAFQFLLVQWKKRELDGETHQNPDQDRFTSN